MRAAWKDVVEAEELVVDHSLDEIEEAPAGEHAAREDAAVPRVGRPAGRAEEKDDARNGQQPDRKVEKAVLGVLPLEIRHRVGLAGGGGTNHVVPPEDLVEYDAIEKSAQTESKDDSGAKKRVDFHANRSLNRRAAYVSLRLQARVIPCPVQAARFGVLSKR